jgi:pyruvate dehydrogenase E1 component alpha subunit
MIKVKKIVDESVKFAEESPEPIPNDLYEDVYKQKDYPFIKE